MFSELFFLIGFIARTRDINYENIKSKSAELIAPELGSCETMF